MAEMELAGGIALDGRPERASEGSEPAESEATRLMTQYNPQAGKATDFGGIAR